MSAAQQNFIIFRAAKLKQGRGSGTLAQAWRHLSNHDRITQISRPELSYLNRSQVLPEIEQVGGINAYKRMLITQHNKVSARKLRSDAAIAVEFLFSFSPNVMPDKPDLEYLKRYEEKLLEFVKAEFPDIKILRFDRHADELSMHYHVIATHTDEKGKIDIKKMLGGPAEFRQHQDRVAEFFSSLGLHRGIPKKITKTRHKTALKWWSKQNLNQRRLNAYEKMFGTPEDWEIEQAAEFNIAWSCTEAI